MATIIRGKTPENIKQQCLQLCADYLSGQWIHISREQLVFKRITGGFTNQLYFCSLPYDMKPISNEPKQVVIKFYGEKHFKTNDETLDDRQRFTDGIIGLTVANNKLGPDIYGLFPSGQIMDFIEV
jgi:hypothetical protein